MEALTVYAFSAENWKRSTEEVGALMRLLAAILCASEIDELDEKNVRILHIWATSTACRLPEKQQRRADSGGSRRTATKTPGLQLNIALNYGGQRSSTRAARLIGCRRAAAGHG